jgi:hypothetical protein
MNICVCMYVYIYIHIHTYTYIYIKRCNLCSDGMYCSEDSDIILNQVPPCIVHVVTAVHIKFDEHFDY